MNPPCPDGAPGPARPSLARTSISTQVTERSLSAGDAGGGLAADIRGDVARGWGAAPPDGDNNSNNNDDYDWGWALHRAAVRPLPSFCPLDPRAVRRVRLPRVGGGAQQQPWDTESDTGVTAPQMPEQRPPVHAVSRRISRACQALSLHGRWDDAAAHAALRSMERVEMEVALHWDDATAAVDPPVVLVEVQRRKGDAVAFHHYRRCLLDAAEGTFDPDAFKAKARDPDATEARDVSTNASTKAILRGPPRASLKRPGLARPGLGRTNPGPSPFCRDSLGPDITEGPTRQTLSPPGRTLSPPRRTLSPPGSSSPDRPPPLSRPRLARPTPLAPPAVVPEAEMVPSLRSPSLSVDFDAAAAPPSATLKTPEGGPGRGGRDADALQALTMAAGLLRKDRLDARTLGMESLVLLTDRARAGKATADVAARVVLLGAADRGAGDGDDVDVDVDALFDESAGLGLREMILEMILTDNGGNGAERAAAEEDGDGIEKEFRDGLFNLCLTVLSNALTVLGEEHTVGKAPSDAVRAGEDEDLPREASPEPPKDLRSEEDDGDDNSDDDRKSPPLPSASPLQRRARSEPLKSPRIEEDDGGDDDHKLSPPRRRAATEPAVRPAGVSKRFIDDTAAAFGGDVLSALLGLLARAEANPHDAYHSARCLGVLFRGCGDAHKARARRDLDAKRIVAMALEVGSRSHAKLEDASRAAMQALVTDDEGSGAEEEKEDEATQVERETAEMEDEAVETGEETEVEQQGLDELPSAMEQTMPGYHE